MPDGATEERRDTYDSRRIDGLVSSVARIEERVDNLREALSQFGHAQQDAAKAARSLRNSILAGCATAAAIASAEFLLRSSS